MKNNRTRDVLLLISGLGAGAVIGALLAPAAIEAVWRRLPVRYKAAGALGAVRGAGLKAYRDARARVSV